MNASVHETTSIDIGNGNDVRSTIAAERADPGGQPELLVLACDGLWARCTEQYVVGFIRDRLYAGVSWKDGKEQR